MLLVQFAIFYSFSVLLAVVTRSTVACVFGSVLFWLLAWGINYGSVMARGLPETQYLPAVTLALAEVAYWIFPKPIDAGLILFNALDAHHHFEKPVVFKLLESGPGILAAVVDPLFARDHGPAAGLVRPRARTRRIIEGRSPVPLIASGAPLDRLTARAPAPRSAARRGAIRRLTSNVAAPRPVDGNAGQDLEESFQGLDIQVDPGRLVVHREDQPGPDRVDQRGDLGEVDRRRPAGRGQHDVRPAQGASSAALSACPRSPRKTRCSPSLRKWTIVTSSSGRRSGVSKTWTASTCRPRKVCPPAGPPAPGSPRTAGRSGRDGCDSGRSHG